MSIGFQWRSWGKSEVRGKMCELSSFHTDVEEPIHRGLRETLEQGQESWVPLSQPSMKRLMAGCWLLTGLRASRMLSGCKKGVSSWNVI